MWLSLLNCKPDQHISLGVTHSFELHLHYVRPRLSLFFFFFFKLSISHLSLNWKSQFESKKSLGTEQASNKNWGERREVVATKSSLLRVTARAEGPCPRRSRPGAVQRGQHLCRSGGSLRGRGGVPGRAPGSGFPSWRLSSAPGTSWALSWQGGSTFL